MKTSSTIRLSETPDSTERAMLERQFRAFETELAHESTIMEHYLTARKAGKRRLTTIPSSISTAFATAGWRPQRPL